MTINNNWKKWNPKTATKDEEILLLGKWKDFGHEGSIFKGGQACTTVAKWSKLYSPNDEKNDRYCWVSDMTDIDNWNVEWLYWCNIPELPDDFYDKKTSKKKQ